MLRFISSVRLAVILIAALSGLAVAATIYDLPEMYQSWPFRIIVAAFFINLLTCSLGLWPKVVRKLRRGADSLAGSEVSMKLSSLNDEILTQTLHKNGYKNMSHHETAEGHYLLARKNRPQALAPHILHAGILVILVGAFMASFAVTGQLMLTAGESQPLPASISEAVGDGTISLKDFVTTYDDEGNVENWLATFDLKLDGEVVAEDATTSVNHPYKKNGLSIYQMAYKNMYVIHIEGSEDVTGDYAIPESQRFPLGENTLDIEPMTEGIALLYVFDQDNNEVSKEALKEGDVVSVSDDTTIEYIQPLSATVLEFKYSRANPVIFAGFILAVLASLLFLLGRYSEVHAFIANDGSVYLRVLDKNAYTRRKMYAQFGISEQEDEEAK